MPTLRNTNPMGDITVYGRDIAAGETFEVTAEQAGKAPTTNKDGEVTDLGSGLLAQIGNFELVTDKKKG